MPSDSPALISPDPRVLPLLFEVGRLLARGLEAADALPALLSLLEGGSSLRGGLAAASRLDGGELRFEGVVLLKDGPLIGRPLDFGASSESSGLSALDLEAECLASIALMSRAYALGMTQAEGTFLALPALAGGRAVAVFGFRLPRDLDPAGKALAQDLAEAAAALYAEAVLLRHQVGEEARRALAFEEPHPAPSGRRSPVPAGPRASCADYSDGGGLEGAARSRVGGDAHASQALASLLGASQAMAEVRVFIGQVAPTDSTVLLLGESGTGKEVAARAIHAASTRAAGPFVAVNCAALPATLIESELFGHERGAFTGAQNRRLGRFELAEGGTLFLDEVAELPLALQAKLLRALQERVFERVGGTRPVRVDLRVIAATNRDLEREVVESRFRADLYWRLAVFPVRMPPLRERGGDIVVLADHFTEAFARSTGRPVCRISTPALDLLTSYHWPGNVRELENAIERAVILSTDGVIHAYHLPPSLQSAQSTGTGPGSTLDAALARLERELLMEALKIEAGNAAAAARSLGITERRIGLALKRYGIDWRRFRRHAH